MFEQPVQDSNNMFWSSTTTTIVLLVITVVVLVLECKYVYIMQQCTGVGTNVAFPQLNSQMMLSIWGCPKIPRNPKPIRVHHTMTQLVRLGFTQPAPPSRSSRKGCSLACGDVAGNGKHLPLAECDDQNGWLVTVLIMKHDC